MPERRTGAPGPYTLAVVSDDCQYGRLLKYGFEIMGAEVSLVEEGDDVLSTLRNLRPDGLILDMSIAIADGVQLLNRLRNDAALDIPALVLSSSDDRAFSVEILVAGARDVLIKPATFPAILERVERMLGSENAPASGEKERHEVE